MAYEMLMCYSEATMYLPRQPGNPGGSVKRFPVLAVLTMVGSLALSATAGAQLANTGLFVNSGLDQRWNLSITSLGVPDPSAVFAPIVPQYNSPTSSAATVVTTIPSPPWAPNAPGNYQWIGASETGTLGVTSGTPTGDAISRFRYTFSTTFSMSGNELQGVLGWDNRMLGYQIGAGPLTQFAPAAAFDQSGFCRNADGEFGTGAFPACLRSFTINQAFTSGQTFSIVLEGDGKTDGLLFVTPEPSTYLLVGAGLAGMMVASRRRRRLSA
jgi:hypothetical protein